MHDQYKTKKEEIWPGQTYHNKEIPNQWLLGMLNNISLHCSAVELGRTTIMIFLFMCCSFKIQNDCLYFTGSRKHATYTMVLTSWRTRQS